jgi:hypothetical protein
VRRLVAALVLGVFGLLPVTGALSNIAAHAADLPLCCRAHGKHKCALRLLQHAPAGSPAQPVIYPVCGHYPLLPLANLAAVNIPIFPPKDSELFHVAILSHLAAQFDREVRFNKCFERSHWKRGPPTFFS